MQPIPSYIIPSQKVKPNSSINKKGENSPNQELIDKAMNYVSPYFARRFPCQKLSEVYEYEGYKITQVCMSNPYDTLTCAIPSYTQGYVMTFKCNNVAVEVNMDKKGVHIYAPLIDRDETRNIPAEMMHLIMTRIKKLTADFNPQNIEVFRATRTLFDKNSMIQTMSFYDNNRNEAISGFNVFIKCFAKTFIVAVAEDPNEIRIRIDEEKPKESVHQMKRKTQEDEVSESSSEGGNNLKDEVDDFGYTSKPMSIQQYQKQLKAKSLDPAIRIKVEIIAKKNVLPPEVFSLIKQNFFDRLILRYPFAEINSDNISITKVQWVPQLSLPASRGVDKKPGFEMIFRYGNEEFSVFASERGDQVNCKGMEELMVLPKEVRNALEHAAGLLYEDKYLPENFLILDVKEVQWRDEQSTKQLKPLHYGYRIKFCLSSSIESTWHTTIDINGIVKP